MNCQKHRQICCGFGDFDATYGIDKHILIKRSHPGMTVQQLLDILRITKQSLGRVLKELIDKGYVFQKEGETDRRQRLLYLTEAGEELRPRLMGPQLNRIRRAGALPEGSAAHLYRKVLYHMVSPANREAVRDWIDRASLLGEPKDGG